MVSLDKCDFSRLTSSPCGKSDHYTIDKLLFNIFECSKEAITHLQTVKCTERTFSSSSTHGSFPESLLILYRSGIFSIDNGSYCLWIYVKNIEMSSAYIGSVTRCAAATLTIQHLARQKQTEEHPHLFAKSIGWKLASLSRLGQVSTN